MSSPEPDAPEPFRLLVMCTANRCRSPMAASLADAGLRARRVPAIVASCGVHESGAPAVTNAVGEMARRGLDLTGHLSRQVDSALLAWAQLVVTMERSHLVAIAEVDLGAVSRAFTLRELARIAEFLGRRPAGQGVGEWVAAADRVRDPNVLALSTSDDVPDPLGRSRRTFRRSATEIDDLLGIVLDGLFGSPVTAIDR